MKFRSIKPSHFVWMLQFTVELGPESQQSTLSVLPETFLDIARLSESWQRDSIVKVSFSTSEEKPSLLVHAEPYICHLARACQKLEGACYLAMLKTLCERQWQAIESKKVKSFGEKTNILLLKAAARHAKMDLIQDVVRHSGGKLPLHFFVWTRILVLNDKIKFQEICSG
ncbi:hypothetical protein HIM_07923 [Hirsutella minnesotensis 3608]|uniref:Uncharacterized protein n=1 Tax=Hirsutella minnesotensis 3608 TaxID=1043627 RepID=A0A0F7ZHJ1_9HYPO|nr:hypothetical protein HIM_07923 [Hirsutella minnesotensis 3608]